jgi:glutamine amidotransferase
MCLALYKPADKTVKWDALQNAMEYNPDGAGFAVAVDGQLIIEKGFFKWADFRRAFEPFAQHAAIVHFRLATHGAKNQANCHPFSLADFGGPDGHKPVAVIHNGIFYEAKNDKKQWSDTWHVCRDILHPLWLEDPDSFEKDHLLLLGNKFVGTSNKLVFLAADGKAVIWGEGNGHWADGVWYSNHSYECQSYADPRYRGYKAPAAGRKTYVWEYDDDDGYYGAYGKSAKASAEAMEEQFTEKELEEFATGKFDDETSILDLDTVEGDREQCAFAELRQCGYTEVELEEIYLDEGLDGLVGELARMYQLSEDDVTCWLGQEILKLRRDGDGMIDVRYDSETNLFVPAQ